MGGVEVIEVAIAMTLVETAMAKQNPGHSDHPHSRATFLGVFNRNFTTNFGFLDETNQITQKRESNSGQTGCKKVQQ